MDWNPQDFLVNIDKANNLLDSLEDGIDKEFIKMFHWKISRYLLNMTEKDNFYPQSPLDLYFLYVVICDLLKHKESLKKLLDGDLEVGNLW